MKKVGISLLFATLLALPLTTIAQAEGNIGGVTRTIIITNPAPDENALKDGIQIIPLSYLKHNVGTNLQLQIIKDRKIDTSANVRYMSTLTLERQGFSTSFMAYFHEGVAIVPVNFALSGKQNVSITVDQRGKQTISVNVE